MHMRIKSLLIGICSVLFGVSSHGQIRTDDPSEKDLVFQRQIYHNTTNINGLRVFKMSFSQAPPVLYIAVDSIADLEINAVFLDTLVKITGTDHYDINWQVRQNGEFVNIQKQIQLERDTLVYFRILFNTACAYFDSVFIKYRNSTNVHEKALLNKDIRLYPNPSSGKLTLDIADAYGSIDISIIDLLGKQVMHENMETISRNQTIELDITSLTPGTYTIVLLMQNRRYHQLFTMINQ
jgi:hypothetical protein